MAARVSDLRTDVEGLDELASLWKQLHTHHREVSDYKGLVEDLDDSWARRRALYRRLLEDGGAYLTARDGEGRLIGYAMVALELGADDTFEVSGGIAELVTLVVSRDQRSAGVGRALVAAVEEIARDRGIDTVKIAVMSGNHRAQAFYGSLGYEPGEQVLYRRLDDR